METFKMIEFIEWSCARCGCVNCMPTSFNEQLRATHKTFWCVNGHANVYNHRSSLEVTEEKLMNEYAKNAQLEVQIKKINKSLFNKIFNRTKNK